MKLVAHKFQKLLANTQNTLYTNDLIVSDSLVLLRHCAVYRVRQIKVIPCRVLLISQQRIGIFTPKFTQLFIIHIYV